MWAMGVSGLRNTGRLSGLKRRKRQYKKPNAPPLTAVVHY